MLLMTKNGKVVDTSRVSQGFPVVKTHGGKTGQGWVPRPRGETGHLLTPPQVQSLGHSLLKWSHRQANVPADCTHYLLQTGGGIAKRTRE